MKKSIRTTAFVLGAACLSVIAFGLGHWHASLQQGIREDANYPWDLHREIGHAAISCEQLTGGPLTGNFYVHASSDSNILVIATLDKQKETATGFALDAIGRIASDSWPMQCKSDD